MSDDRPDRKELGSWKEIADYLGVSVRAAQRWERHRDLPVRRLPGGKGRVSAEAAALDRWRAATLAAPRWWASVRFVRYYALLSTLLLLIIAGVLAHAYITTRRGVPSRFFLHQRTLVVTDDHGTEIWTKTFPDAFRVGISDSDWLATRRAWFGDLDDDGRIELLFVYEPASVEHVGSALICFSDRGEEKWRFVPGRAVSTPTTTFSPIYLVAQIQVASRCKSRDRIVLVTSHHLSFYPNQFVVLSPKGAVLGEYWHSGDLYEMATADLDGDGCQEVLLAGVSNGYKAGTMVALDLRDVGGASAEEDQSYQLQRFGPGRERARILFPRSCINRKFEDYNLPYELAVQQNWIGITIRERTGDPSAGEIYRLNSKLELVDFDVSDRFKTLHRELESAGQLDHPLTADELSALRRLRVLKPLPRSP